MECVLVPSTAGAQQDAEKCVCDGMTLVYHCKLRFYVCVYIHTYIPR